MKPLKSLLIAATLLATATGAQAWSLKEASKPYRGVTITVVGLERPSYHAAQKLTPQFEEITGINVEWVSFPYESSLKSQTLNFVSHSLLFDAILADVVWPVTFAQAGWVVPLERFLNDPKLANPDIDMDDFFDIWLTAFTVDGKLYGLPFDSYAGLLYYNKAILKEHGFDGPPDSWKELVEDYAPVLYKPEEDLYPFALQSAKGETQTADSFTRFLWPWGGRYLDADTRQVLLDQPEAVAGIKFRQGMMDIMPKGIVADNHSQVVQMMGQGQVAMITEWSAFYPTLKDSEIGDVLGIALEPKGPDGRYAAFGGFAYMVSSQVPEKRQNAAWLFIQWLTSKEMARPLIKNGAVVARISADTDPQIQEQFPYLAPMVETWRTASVPDWRPLLRCYPRFSEIVSDWGTRIQLGSVPVEEGMEELDAALQQYMDSSQCWSTVQEPRES